MISDLLNTMVDVVYRTITKDASGGKVDDEEIVAADVPCRIVEGGSRKGQQYRQETEQASHRIYMETDLRRFVQPPRTLTQARLVLRAGNSQYGADRYFDLRGLKDPDELGEYFIVTAEEFRP